jgi:hypothetical protein
VESAGAAVILEDLCAVLDANNLPHYTAEFPERPPETYCVLVPICDSFAVQGDGAPLDELQEVRLSLFSKNNYIAAARQLAKALLQAGFSITQRTYVGFENETKVHHYSLDLAKLYFWEEV